MYYVGLFIDVVLLTFVISQNVPTDFHCFTPELCEYDQAMGQIVFASCSLAATGTWLSHILVIEFQWH